MRLSCTRHELTQFPYCIQGIGPRPLHHMQQFAHSRAIDLLILVVQKVCFIAFLQHFARRSRGFGCRSSSLLMLNSSWKLGLHQHRLSQRHPPITTVDLATDVLFHLSMLSHSKCFFLRFAHNQTRLRFAQNQTIADPTGSRLYFRIEYGILEKMSALMPTIVLMGCH